MDVGCGIDEDLFKDVRIYASSQPAFREGEEAGEHQSFRSDEYQGPTEERIGKEENETVICYPLKLGMLIGNPEAESHRATAKQIGTEPNDGTDTTDMCYDMLLHSTFPSEEMAATQGTQVDCAETYIASLHERGGMLSGAEPAPSPSDYFQSTNVDVPDSTNVSASWGALHSSHVEAKFGTRPLSPDHALSSSGNSVDEMVFIDPLCEVPPAVDGLNRGPSYCGGGVKNGRLETVRSSAAAEMGDDRSSLPMEESNERELKETFGAVPQHERVARGELSLRNVLSDPLTGALMDDAMVATCGHSFGSASLQRALETQSCINCGASFPPNTLVPNFALRAAILAYRHEDRLFRLSPVKGTKRSREQFQSCPDSELKDNPADLVGAAKDAYMDNSRPRGVQFPFAVSERVLIKGNKRTPERFFGMEAIITNQCLNGWYLVRTVDTGESVRLQYRSLQKVGDGDTPSNSDETLVDQSIGPHETPFSMQNHEEYPSGTTSILENSVESMPGASQLNDAILSSSIASEDLRASLPRKESSASLQRYAFLGDVGTSSTLNDATFHSTTEEQVHQEMSSNIVDDNSTPVGRVHEQDVAEIRAVPSQDNGKESSGMCSRQVPLRPTGSVTSTAILQELDPRQKVNPPSFGQHSTKEDHKVIMIPDHLLEDSKVSLGIDDVVKGSERTNKKSLGVGTIVAGPQGRAIKLRRAHDILQIMRKDMLTLEKQIPQSYLLRSWRRHRINWRKHVKSSETVSELGAQVQDFRCYVLLTAAGGMSNEEWDKRIGLIIESGDVELLVSLWGRLYDDVYRWLELRPNVLQRKVTQLPQPSFDDVRDTVQRNAGGSDGPLSSVCLTTAATLAAVDAVAEGQKDPDENMKDLLDLAMKLLPHQTGEQLLLVREALEREKRHITAKLAYLDTKFASVEATSVPNAPTGGLAVPTDLSDNLPQSEQNLSATEIPGFQGPSRDFLEDGDSDSALPPQDVDGESTDLSDSD